MAGSSKWWTRRIIPRFGMTCLTPTRKRWTKHWTPFDAFFANGVQCFVQRFLVGVKQVIPNRGIILRVHHFEDPAILLTPVYFHAYAVTILFHHPAQR